MAEVIRMDEGKDVSTMSSSSSQPHANSQGDNPPERNSSFKESMKFRRYIDNGTIGPQTKHPRLAEYPKRLPFSVQLSVDPAPTVNSILISRKRKASLSAVPRSPRLRFSSDYSWKGEHHVKNLLANTSSFTNKFTLLTCRPPDSS